MEIQILNEKNKQILETFNETNDNEYYNQTNDDDNEFQKLEMEEPSTRLKEISNQHL